MNSMLEPLLLVSVVRRGRGDRVVELARRAGAQGSTVALARGAAANRLLCMLCLGDTEKEVVYTIAPQKDMPAIIDALRSAPDLSRRTPGFGLIIPVSSFMRPGGEHMAPQLNKACGNCQRQLVCVVANAGYSDDIMHAARSAGARGGTIIRARGTASEQDSSFFGITIVPEKELVLILTPNADAEPILDAIRKLPCLAEPGVGIIFCLPVSSFFPLGEIADQQAGAGVNRA
ncbi:MAG: P-II family nitrogen regulator [Desulfovibrio sp.]|nr:P-II family nitrogen regulator [Desulfovibrio sp.]